MAKTKNTVVEPVETTTEIEAPYELPDGWRWCSLEKLCSIPITDGTHQTPTYSDEENGIPFISSKDVTKQYIDWERIKYITKELHTELYKRVAPKIDDILLAKNGTTGVAAIVDTDKIFDIYVTLALLRPNKDLIVPNYLLNVVNSPICKNQFDEHLTGIGVPNLHLRDIKVTQIPLPPTITEQQRIVSRIESLFSKLDSAKEKAQNVVDSFENRKAAILHKAFTGELTKKWRAENGVGEDSWVEKKLEEISSKITDGEHSTPKRVDTFCGYYLLSARNIHNGEIRLNDVDYVNESEYERIRKRCNPDKNDILISCSGSVGRVCVIQDDNKYVMVRSAAMIKINECNSFFIAYMLQSFNVQQQIEKTKKQSCQANLFLGAIKELVVPVPTLPEQQEIVRILDVILEKENKAKEAAEAVLEQIELLKKSILARAFRGEL